MNGERQRLRQWLESQINSGRVPQLCWVDKSRGIFKVPWKHAGKPGFVLERDAVLFREWARHTGKYKDGEQPDPSTWKTRFRCAINKLPDIEEIKERSNLDSDEPYRVFQFIPKGMTAKNDLPDASSPHAPPSTEIKPEENALDAPFVMDDGNNLDAVQQQILDDLELTDDTGDMYLPAEFMPDFPTIFGESPQPDPVNPINPMKAITEIIGMGPEAMALELNVKIYYHEKQVAEKVVSNRLGCRIHSGLDLTRVPDFNYGAFMSMFGPREAEQIQFPDEGSPSSFMDKLDTGLLLMWENNNIVAYRFCQAHVYASGGCLGSNIIELARREQTKVFDYDYFLAGLAEYRVARAPLPLYEVFFSFGQRPATSTTVDPGVLVTVSVTHLTAKASISKMGSGADVIMSIEDDTDRLAKNFKYMLQLQPQYSGQQPREGCGI